MVVKVLGGGSSGIDYNEEKIEKGKAEILSTANMFFTPNGETADKNEIRATLEDSMNKSKRAKNRQFHAVISAKGKSKDNTELTKMAHDYMEHMGYKDQPYAIYVHTDTKNNHVHIVSSRINEDGKQIKKDFEKLRSQDFIRDKLGIRHSQAESKVINTGGYKFETVGQYISILESKGLQAQKKDNHVNVFESGRQVGSIDLNEIKDASMKVDDEKRRKQLTAIFHKYAETLTQKEFQESLKKKMGVSVVFHKAKDKELNYGYTVIDNKNKQVFKGSDIMKRSQLEKKFESVEKGRENQDIPEFIKQSINKSVTLSELNKNLSQKGLIADYKGRIRFKNGIDTVDQIKQDTIKELNYNERLEAAKEFTATSSRDKQVLARFFFIKKEDEAQLNQVEAGEKTVNNSDYYKKVINSMKTSVRPVKEELKDMGIDIFKYQDKYYVLDKKDNNFSSVNVDLNQKQAADIKNFDHNLKNENEQSVINQMPTEGLSLGKTVDNLLSALNYGDVEEDKKKKKKKRTKRSGPRR